MSNTPSHWSAWLIEKLSNGLSKIVEKVTSKVFMQLATLVFAGFVLIQSLNFANGVITEVLKTPTPVPTETAPSKETPSQNTSVDVNKLHEDTLNFAEKVLETNPDTPTATVVQWGKDIYNLEESCSFVENNGEEFSHKGEKPLYPDLIILCNRLQTEES